ncbi:MAG TPA: hypothetical protein PLL49_04025 [Bacteroidales bacterium]|nr:hypothetical protein [Bacteroidales bacterium]
MKVKLFPLFSLFVILAVTMISCQEELLNIDIPIKNQKVAFHIEPASKSTANSGNSNEVLFDGVVDINIAEYIEGQGVSFEHLKSFVITQGTLEEVVPTGYDMQGFIGAELYFDNRDSLSNLVARAEVATESTLQFTIINGELLDQLHNDQLHIILVGTRPPIPLFVQLSMDFLANFQLIE